MRAIRAELRATSARKHRKRVPGSEQRTPNRVTPSMEQVPGGERQTIQIVNCKTGEGPRWNLSGGDPHCGLLGLAFDDEVGVILQKFRRLCRRRSEKSNPPARLSFGFL